MEKKEWQRKGAGHRQRLRDRFLEKGIETFSDVELIELLLTFGTPRRDCKETARQALDRFGSLPAVLDASAADLARIKGLGPKNIFALHFIQGVARRYLKQRIKGKNYIHSSREVADYLIHALRGREREYFAVVYLDASHGILGSEILFQGTVNVSTVYPRELIKAALARNATALVVAHNHPSGSLQPSSQDRQLTRHLWMACSFMQINLLDHLIIGAGAAVYSFADHGLMAEIRSACGQIMAAATSG